MSRRLYCLAAAALFAAPLPAIACSVVSGYRVPTNMELVEQADMIVLATVTGGRGSLDDPGAMAIDIAPVAALKGDPAAAPRTIPLAPATGQYALLSNPYDLESAHPLAYTGGCYRWMAPVGTRILFFVSKQGGAWAPAGGPFSRLAEDVLTDDAPWLIAVKFYLEVQALPQAERAAALTARRDALRAKTADPIAQLFADDIDRQLAGPNKPLREDLPPAPDDAAEGAPAR